MQMLLSWNWNPCEGGKGAAAGLLYQTDGGAEHLFRLNYWVLCLGNYPPDSLFSHCTTHLENSLKLRPAGMPVLHLMVLGGLLWLFFIL